MQSKTVRRAPQNPLAPRGRGLGRGGSRYEHCSCIIRAEQYCPLVPFTFSIFTFLFPARVNQKPGPFVNIIGQG